MTKEAILGLFVLIVFLVFLFFTINMGTMIFAGGERTFHLYFDNIGTLEVGAPVKQAGYDVGEVSGIALQTIAEPTPTTYIVVDVKVADDAIISTDSNASLQTLGMMGEKYIEISFGKGPPATSETHINGHGPMELDRVMENAVNLTNEVQKTVQSLNRILGDPEVTDNITSLISNLENFSVQLNLIFGGENNSINATITNTEAATAKLNSLLATAELFVDDVHQITQRNEKNINTTLDNVAVISQDVRENLIGDIKETAKQLKGFSLKLDDSISRANNLIANMEGLVVKNRDNIDTTIGNLKDVSTNAKQASSKIRDMLEQDKGMVHDLFYDPEFSSSAKATLTKASEVLGTSTNLGEKFTFDAELAYFPDRTRFSRNETNIRADIGLQYDISDKWYAYVGGNNLGASNDFESQLGYRWKQLRIHAGIIESELGAGVDWQVMDRWMLGLQGVGLSESHEERLDVYTEYMLWNDIYLTGGVQDVTNNAFPNAGVKVRF